VPEPRFALASSGPHRALYCHGSSSIHKALAIVPASEKTPTGRRRVLSHSQTRHRIPAGSDSRRTLDFPKGGVESGLTHAQSLPSRLLKRLAFMAGWKKSPSPVTSARDLQLRQETRGLLLADLPRQRLPSPPTFAKCRGSKRRRNRIETPPGFPLKKRSSVSSKTARRNLAQNSRASSTGRGPHSAIARRLLPRTGSHETGSHQAGSHESRSHQKRRVTRSSIRSLRVGPHARPVRSASYHHYIRGEHADLQSSAGRSAQAEIPVDARLYNRPTLRLGNGTAPRATRCKSAIHR